MLNLEEVDRLVENCRLEKSFFVRVGKRWWCRSKIYYAGMKELALKKLP